MTGVWVSSGSGAPWKRSIVFGTVTVGCCRGEKSLSVADFGVEKGREKCFFGRSFSRVGALATGEAGRLIGDGGIVIL